MVASTKAHFGAKSYERPWVGLPMSEVRFKLKDDNSEIPPDARARVAGNPVDDKYVIQPNDEVEFQKQAAQKG